MSKYLASCSTSGPLTDDHKAAYDFVERMRPEAASGADGLMWHGWALREAFLRGVEYMRKGENAALLAALTRIHQIADSDACSEELEDAQADLRAIKAIAAEGCQPPSQVNGQEKT